MELVKGDKKDKPIKKPHPGIQELIDAGIPLQMVTFNRTVRSFKGEPETAFYHRTGHIAGPQRDAKPSRTAKIWFTPHGVVTEQDGFYKVIPLANVIDTIVL